MMSPFSRASALMQRRQGFARLSLSVLSAFLALKQCDVQAREVKLWSTSELAQHSDLVIIGRLQSWKAIDNNSAGETTKSLLLKEFGVPFQHLLMTREAIISVDIVIKGALPDKFVNVLLFDYATNTHNIENGPRFLSTDMVKSESPAHVLLFLRVGAESRWIPTSGHWDPVDSVFMLTPPHDWYQLQRMLEKQRTFTPEDSAEVKRRMDEFDKKTKKRQDDRK